jgi:hypothetical protein
MGEAKRRAERRREAEHLMMSEPKYDPRVAKVREFNAIMVDKLAFESEYGPVAEENPQVTPQIFIVALIESGLEKLRQAREAREEHERTKNNLIVPATHLPPGIAEAAARLEALKKRA